MALKMSLPEESESFYLLLNFEHDDSGVAVKMLFHSGLIPLVFISFNHFHHFTYRLRPLSAKSISLDITSLTYSVGDGEENLEEREQEYDVEDNSDNVQEINDKAKARMKFKVSVNV